MKGKKEKGVRGLGPVDAVADAFLRAGYGLLDYHPEHDGCGEAQRVPVLLAPAK